MKYFRTIGQLDVGPILDRAALLRLEKPRPDDLTQPGLLHKAVALRMHHPPWAIKDFLEDHPAYDRPLLSAWPAMQELLGAARAMIAHDPVIGPMVDHNRLGRVVFSLIEPQGYVPWHVDHGLYVQRTRRFHIPLVTSLKAVNYAPDEIAHLPVGQLTWLDNRSLHSAGNWSDAWRNHIIFELYDAAAPA
jgi:hypothetical protein